MNKGLLILSGSKDSIKIYEEYVLRGLDFDCLQFISETIEPLYVTHRKIHHVYIPKISSTTKSKTRLKRQNTQMLFVTLGLAKGIGAKTISLGIKKDDIEDDFLKDWILEFMKGIKELASLNKMNVVFPLIEGVPSGHEKK